MPTIEQSLSSNLDLSNYTPAKTPPVSSDSLFIPNAIRADMFLRCPVPPQGAISPDDLRQFYKSSIPQYRILIGN